jgi:DNA-directed RNA polymerase subunit RPC12/RpoP
MSAPPNTAPLPTAPATTEAAKTDAPAPVTYICAMCLMEQHLSMQQAVMCTHCAHEHSASKIFFKKRTVHTSYTTI